MGNLVVGGYLILSHFRPFSEWRQEGGIIVNNVRMPDPPVPPAPAAGGGASTRQRFGGSFRRAPAAVSGPTPLDKRVLVQEEFDKRLKVHLVFYD